jgi:hypothetical protein
VGAHGKAQGGLNPEEIELVKAARLEALKLNLDESLDTVTALRQWNPSIFLVIRVTGDFSGEAVESGSFVDAVEPDIARLYNAGIRYFELHASPNLQVEGWQRSWSDGKEFAIWLRAVARTLRDRFADISLETVSGWRANAEEFLHDAEPAVHELDWCGVNCYWTDTFGMQSIYGGRWFEFYRNRFPEKLLMITEFFNASPGAEESVKAEQALAYFRSLRNEVSLAAAFSFVVASSQGYENIRWSEPGVSSSVWAEVIGGRSF